MLFGFLCAFSFYVPYFWIVSEMNIRSWKTSWGDLYNNWCMVILIGKISKLHLCIAYAKCIGKMRVIKGHLLESRTQSYLNWSSKFKVPFKFKADMHNFKIPFNGCRRSICLMNLNLIGSSDWIERWNKGIS